MPDAAMSSVSICVICGLADAMVRWLINVMIFAMFFAFLAIFAVKLRCVLYVFAVRSLASDQHGGWISMRLESSSPATTTTAPESDRISSMPISLRSEIFSPRR